MITPVRQPFGEPASSAPRTVRDDSILCRSQFIHISISAYLTTHPFETTMISRKQIIHTCHRPISAPRRQNPQPISHSHRFPGNRRTETVAGSLVHTTKFSLISTSASSAAICDRVLHTFVACGRLVFPLPFQDYTPSNYLCRIAIGKGVE
jgi:hypothetical protein